MSLLLDHHKEHLHTSGLSDETIEAMGCESVSADQVPRILNWPRQWSSGGIVFWYPGVPDYCQIRFDEPQEFQEEGRQPRKVRYLKPKGSQNHAYILPAVKDILHNLEVTLYFTEGEKKAAKLTQEGFPCIGLSGVWSWLTTSESESGSKEKGLLLPEIMRIPMNGRRLYLIWDSDAVDKPDVMRGGERFRATLSKRNAQAYLSVLPGDPAKKIGADDFLVAHGAVPMLSFLEESRRESEQRNFDVPRIIKMDTDPAVYRLWIFDTEVVMGIKELMAFKSFQRQVTERCDRVPFMKDSRNEWTLYLDELLQLTMEVEEAPAEASTFGLIWEHTKDFLRHDIEESNFVEGGQGPLKNETNFYIHGPTLLQYLRAEMGGIPGPQVWTALRQRGADTQQKHLQNAEGKWVNVRVWTLPTNLIEEPVELEGPPPDF